MLTKAEITTASATLDELDIAMWVALINRNPIYQANPILYPDLEATIDSVSGDIKGKMLNALADRIEILGIGEASIKNGDEGLNYSQTQERDALVSYALSILYAVPVTTVLTDSAGKFGDYQIRQRSYCNICGCKYHLTWCRYYGQYQC